MKGQSSKKLTLENLIWLALRFDFTAARAPRCAVTLCCAVPSQRRSQPTHTLVSLYALSTLGYRQTRPLAAVHQGPRRRPSPLPRPGRAPQRNAAHTPTRGFFLRRGGRSI